MEHNLRKGSIKDILDNRIIVKPILQVLSVFVSKHNRHDLFKYQARMSDGLYWSNNFLMSNTLNEQIEQNKFQVHSLVRLVQFRPVRNRIFVVNLELIQTGPQVGRILFNPVDIECQNDSSLTKSIVNQSKQLANSRSTQERSVSQMSQVATKRPRVEQQVVTSAHMQSMVAESETSNGSIVSKKLILSPNRVNFVGICSFFDQGSEPQTIYFIDINKNFIKLTIKTNVNFDFSPKKVFKGENVVVSAQNRHHLVLTSCSSLNQVPQEDPLSKKLLSLLDQITDQYFDSTNVNRVDSGKGRKTLYEIIQSTGKLSNASFLANGIIVKSNVLFVYSACIQCQKRLFNFQIGIFACQWCKKEFQTFEPKMVLKLLVMDHTKVVSVNLFHEIAQQLIQVNLKNYGLYQTKTFSDLNRMAEKVVGKRFDFILKPKFNYFNERITIKSDCLSISKPNYRDIGWKLLRKNQHAN